MTDSPTLANMLASLTPEQREQVEKDAQAKVDAAAAEKAATDVAKDELYDVRQDGKLNDVRDLGPTGG